MMAMMAFHEVATGATGCIAPACRMEESVQPGANPMAWLLCGAVSGHSRKHCFLAHTHRGGERAHLWC